MQKSGKSRKVRKQQQQSRPGMESKLNPLPVILRPETFGGKLRDKVVLITGGDSGIGRAIAVLFAREGANIAIAYLNEKDDAVSTKQKVEEYGGHCLLISGDLSKERHCQQVVRKRWHGSGRLIF